MVVRSRGGLVTLPAASELPWRVVGAATADPHAFALMVWPREARLAARDIPAVQEAWIRHNDLPPFPQVRRLVYMIEKYYTGIEYDLRHHLRVSAGELWRDRRWRELLNYIDQLPTNSQMNRLLSTDEEHMEALLRQKRGDDGPARPSMADWSLMNSQLAQLIDAANRNTATQQAIANPKGPKPRIDPSPRPATAAEKVERKLQKARHEEMVGLLLPRDKPAGTM